MNMDYWYVLIKGERLTVDERCWWYRRSDAINAIYVSDWWQEQRDNESKYLSDKISNYNEQLDIRMKELFNTYVSDGTIKIKSSITQNYS